MKKETSIFTNVLAFIITLILALILLFVILGNPFSAKKNNFEMSSVTQKVSNLAESSSQTKIGQSTSSIVTSMPETESYQAKSFSTTHTEEEEKGVSIERLNQMVTNVIEPTYENFNGTVQIAFKELNHDFMYSNYDENVFLYPASLPKLFMMSYIYHLEDKGVLEITDEVFTLIDGMIVYSYNHSYNELLIIAANALNGKNPFTELDTFLDKYGFNDTILHSYYSISGQYEVLLAPFLSDFTFQTTVDDIALFYELLYKENLVSAESSKAMLEILEKQSRTSKIPALLPEHVIFYNKTGELDYFTHDSALILSPNADYILVIMTAAEYDAYQNELAIQEISYNIYNFLNP